VKVMTATYDEVFTKRVDAMTLEQRAEYDAAYATAELASSLAELVYNLRTTAGVTQVELARRMKTTQNSISRLESGGSLPTLRLLDRMGKALGVRMSITVDGAPGAVCFGSAA